MKQARYIIFSSEKNMPSWTCTMFQEVLVGDEVATSGCATWGVREAGATCKSDVLGVCSISQGDTITIVVPEFEESLCWWRMKHTHTCVGEKVGRRVCVSVCEREKSSGEWWWRYPNHFVFVCVVCVRAWVHMWSEGQSADGPQGHKKTFWICLAPSVWEREEQWWCGNTRTILFFECKCDVISIGQSAAHAHTAAAAVDSRDTEKHFAYAWHQDALSAYHEIDQISISLYSTMLACNRFVYSMYILDIDIAAARREILSQVACICAILIGIPKLCMNASAVSQYRCMGWWWEEICNGCSKCIQTHSLRRG